MMLFDLINPSDSYTFQADTLECAAIATLLLGTGQYGARQLDGKEEVPIFLLGGAEQWFTDKFGRSIEDSLKLHKGERAEELIACLNSVLIGDRKEYECTLPMIADDKRDEWVAGWHDRNRSSMNDIGSRAKRIATAIAGNTFPPRAPQQVFVG